MAQNDQDNTTQQNSNTGSETSDSSNEQGGTGESRGGYGGTSPASGGTETEGGQDMQRDGSWSPAGEPAASSYQSDDDGPEKNLDLSADTVEFDNRGAGVGADDLIEPGQTARGL